MRPLSLFLGGALALGASSGCDTQADADAEFAVNPADISLPVTREAARVDIAGHTVSGAGLPIVEGPLFEGPVPVQAGVAFEVMTYSVGGLPTCTRPAASVVSVTTGLATVAVRDSMYQGVCFAVLRYIERVDRVTLTERGPAEVVTAGSRSDGENGHPRAHELRFPVVVE